MSILSVERSNARLKRGLFSRRQAAIGLLALSGLWNIGQAARINRLEVARMETAAQDRATGTSSARARFKPASGLDAPIAGSMLIQAEQARDRARNDLEKMTVKTEREQQPVAAQTATFDAVDDYLYIGECTITSYCPCEACCGQWADGLTATGIPAEPGIVAVDPEVIPLGSVVIIDGQKYLAADTGVKGLHVDVCAAGHQEAEDFGVQAMAVWVVEK